MEMHNGPLFPNTMHQWGMPPVNSTPIHRFGPEPDPDGEIEKCQGWFAEDTRYIPGDYEGVDCFLGYFPEELNKVLPGTFSPDHLAALKSALNGHGPASAFTDALADIEKNLPPQNGDDVEFGKWAKVTMSWCLQNNFTYLSETKGSGAKAAYTDFWNGHYTTYDNTDYTRQQALAYLDISQLTP